MRILAIDPGSEQSAYVLLDTGSFAVHHAFIEPTEEVVAALTLARRGSADELAIEMISCYGMAVGKSVFETCVNIGRFQQAFGSATLVYRPDIKLHLCNSRRAKDANVRQALLDRFPPTGGGATPQIGTKGKTGPLYSVKSHLWAALAVAVYRADQIRDAQLVEARER